MREKGVVGLLSIPFTMGLTGVFLLFLKCNSDVPKKPYDITHYDLTIVPDFNTKTLDLKAYVEIENPGFEDSLWFGLNDRYDSVVVKAVGYPVSFEHENGWVLVHPEKAKKKLKLFFEVKGILEQSNGESREVVEDSSLFLLWSDRFYPIDFNDWATVKTTLVLPSDFLAIAPGILKTRQYDRDNVTYVFEAKKPTVCFSVFADCQWVQTEGEVDGIRMQTMLHPKSQKFADHIFSTSREILQFYSEIFCPYPFDQFSFVTLTGMFARRAFSGFVGYSPEYLEKEFTTTGHDAHETALLWWFYTMRGSGPGGFQWTEGFGDYAEFLYDERFDKPIPKIFYWFRDQYLRVDREEDLYYTELPRGDQKFLHGKYPWLMHIIRYVTGDEPFQRAMRLLFDRFRYSTFTMDEFIATMEEGLGQSLDWWRREWLERKGVPEIVWWWKVERDGERYTVIVDLEQRDELYHFPLEIGIETSEGMRVEKVDLNDMKTTVVFQSDRRPEKIVLDPKGWILMKKTYAD